MHTYACTKQKKKVPRGNEDGVMSANRLFCFVLTVLLSHLCLVSLMRSAD